MGTNALIFFVLMIVLVLLAMRKRRVGPRIVFAEIPRIAVALPRSRLHWFIQFLWVLITLRFGYIMFIQPFRDREIMEEYLAIPGGLIVAWSFYLLAYLPWLIVYLWFAIYFDQKLEDSPRSPIAQK